MLADKRNNEIDNAAKDQNISVKNGDKFTFSMDSPPSLTHSYCQLSIYFDFPAIRKFYITTISLLNLNL